MTDRITVLLEFLADTAIQLGVAEHVAVVGGAVRNHVLGVPVKDLDLVVDTTTLGPNQDSAWLAQKLQSRIPARSNLVTNQYGVAILTISDSWVLHGHELRGEVLEIANARRESYGGEEGKGYKPHLVEPAAILEDLQRRDFTVNTLLWRLADLKNGPKSAPVLDLLGSGIRDLEARTLRTPLDPDRTFSDDPTRMLRAIKFSTKYELDISDATAISIRKNASKLAEMPWDAVRKIVVDDLLQGPAPRHCFEWFSALKLNDVIVDLMRSTQGFQRGVSRAFADVDIRIALLALSYGWPLSPSPVGFFDTGQIMKLQMWLDAAGMPDPGRIWDPDKLWEALKRPPINQVKLFERHGLDGAARQRVVAKARELLLLRPELSVDPKKLEAEVSAALFGG